MIFDEIILKQFEKEYENIVKYKGDNKNQTLLFNTSDIMCLIFQYLFELSNCSLVCSHWLYHVFNPNSIHLFRLFRLVEKTSKQGKSQVMLLEKSSAVTRMWQRLSKVKKIDYRASHTHRNGIDYNQLVLNRLSLMRNVESINVFFRNAYEKDIDLLKVIIENCKDKISSLTFRISFIKKKRKNRNNHNGKSKLSPLKLIHVRHIVNKQAYFPIIWSKKCQTITLVSANQRESTFVSSQWCNCVINHCDCSGIKEFNIDNARFDISMNPNDESTQTMFIQFGQKFAKSVDFKQLTIKFHTPIEPCMLLLWKALQPMIEKNNGYINVDITRAQYFDMQEHEYQMLLNTMQEMNPKIDKLDIGPCRKKNESNKDNTIKMIEKINKSNNSLEWITIDVSNTYYISFIKTLKFPSKLGIVELRQGSCIANQRPQLDKILEIIEWEILVQYKVALLMTFTAGYDDNPNDNKKTGFDVKFDIFCGKIFDLLINKQLAMDININFEPNVNYNPDDGIRKQLSPIFLSHLDEKTVVKDYKLPKYCAAATKHLKQRCTPIVSFAPTRAQHDQKAYRFRVSNVSYRAN